jgi:SpoVK/Ycf46/Vps4 family AAA+-type ATPase
VVIFFDDCESFFLQRGTEHSGTATMDAVNQFNALVEGVKELLGVSLILATNRIDLLDTATVGRMHVKKYIGPPDTAEMVEHLLRIHLRGVPLATPDPVPSLVKRIFDDAPENNFIRIECEEGDETIKFREFLSGRLLTDIVTRAKKLALRRDKGLPNEQWPSGISALDLMEALDREMTNDSLPSTPRTVQEWLRQRGDKRKVVTVIALRNKKVQEAATKRTKSIDRSVV